MITPCIVKNLLVGVDEVALRRGQFEADANGEQAADEEHHRDRHQVHDGDALVVLRQQPRLQAVAVVQVMLLGNLELVQHGLLLLLARRGRFLSVR
jgi:hypothetical protein